jgi:hypothetical protein
LLIHSSYPAFSIDISFILTCFGKNTSKRPGRISARQKTSRVNKGTDDIDGKNDTGGIKSDAQTGGDESDRLPESGIKCNRLF